MVSIYNIKDGLDDWLGLQLSDLAGSNPMMSLLTPVVKYGIMNQIDSYLDYIKLISDKNGMVDFEKIFSETMDKLREMPEMPYKIQGVGSFTIGKGAIKMEIPMLGRMNVVILKEDDFMLLKDSVCK